MHPPSCGAIARFRSSLHGFQTRGPLEKWTYAWSADGNLTEVKLYNSFADCCEAVDRLEAIMASGVYTRYSSERDLVS